MLLNRQFKLLIKIKLFECVVVIDNLDKHVHHELRCYVC